MKCMIRVTCDHCAKQFKKQSHRIKRTKHNFCSHDCFFQYQTATRTKEMNCALCNSTFRRSVKALSSKTGRFFCSQSCAATYNNTHKTHGTRRSKLEVFLEEQIRKEFKKVTLLVNDKTAIGSELDFYFPDLKLGIEMNGIFHYEPIHGQEKLAKIQNNDQRKIIACYERGVELIVIPNTHRYVNKQRKNEYWDGIKKIIKERIG